jgi:transposase
MHITTVGIDLAKIVFQVHGVNERGKTMLRKAFKRADLIKFFANLAPCLDQRVEPISCLYAA